MIKYIKKIICKYIGHYWVYKISHNTCYKICNRCNKIIKNCNTGIINGKLVSKEDAYNIWLFNKELEDKEN